MSTLPREKSTAVRRKQIIEAALMCFTELGFTETTMDHIRRRSKASTGSIYHHFQSKDQLAAAVYLEGLLDYQRGVVAELERHRDAREGISAMVQYHLRWVAEHPAWARYLFQMRQAEFLAPTDGTIEDLNHTFVGQVTQWFAPHIKAKRLRSLPRDLTIALLLGPSQEFTRQYLTGRSRTDITSASKTLADATWRALKTESDDGTTA
jgi:AcrR family transcriptional regulator